MSSRVFRKLKGRDDEIKALASLAHESSSEESEHENVKQKPSNPFALLGGEEGDEVEVTEEPADEVKQTEVKQEVSSGARKKTRKKKKKKNNRENGVVETEDIDKIVSEISSIDENVNVASTDGSKTSNSKKTKYILTVEHRFLDPDNELKRIFGTRTVMHDANFRHRNHSRMTKGTWLCAPSANWPKMSRTGLSMTCINDSHKYKVFKFEHNKDYQAAQFQFLDAVDSSDHNLIAEVLRSNPYHIDSLLALGEICRVNDDSQMARELIERSLYCMERHFHSQFNLATGQCRLPYSRPENRCMYLALYRHMHFVIQRGCSRTALELCKVLLNLDPDEDPLCALLFIDFFALQSGEYEFLIQFFSEWEVQKNLSQLPNFAYSLAMAYFEIALTGNKDFTLADKYLQDALIRFPSVLTLLFDKCSIQPDKEVVDHKFFTTDAAQSSPDGLVLLCNLFVVRNFNLWKTPEILPWLERNVQSVLQRVDAKDPEVAKWKQKYAFICELPGILSLLPPEIRFEQIFSHDPLPPADTVVSYERQTRVNRRGRSENSLGLFLRSVLPQFNPDEPAPENEEDGVGARAVLHEHFQNLMGAMRDMLGELHISDQAEEEEEFREDEWD